MDITPKYLNDGILCANRCKSKNTYCHLRIYAIWCEIMSSDAKSHQERNADLMSWHVKLCIQFWFI